MFIASICEKEQTIHILEFTKDGFTQMELFVEIQDKEYVKRELDKYFSGISCPQILTNNPDKLRELMPILYEGKSLASTTPT